MTDEEYQRALDARDPRGVEMIRQLVALATEAYDRAENFAATAPGHRAAFIKHCHERFAQAAQAFVIELSEARDEGRRAAVIAGRFEQHAHDSHFRHPIEDDGC